VGCAPRRRLRRRSSSSILSRTRAVVMSDLLMPHRRGPQRPPRPRAVRGRGPAPGVVCVNPTQWTRLFPFQYNNFHLFLFLSENMAFRFGEHTLVQTRYPNSCFGETPGIRIKKFSNMGPAVLFGICQGDSCIQ